MTSLAAAPLPPPHREATALALIGRYEDAERIYRGLLQQDPQDALAARNLGLALLGQGRYAEGAPFYEARFDAPGGTAPPDLPWPRWRGESLSAKRVLLWPEQGLGDQIMMARFVSVLQRQGCDVTLVCDPALGGLFARSLTARVIPAAGAVEFPDPDVWLPVMSLVAALDVTPEAMPNAPYLHAAARPAPFRVGMALKGKASYVNDSQRTLPPDLADELLAAPSCASLLPEATGARDFQDTAEIIAGLDLVVCVDTSVAHLAGAMGKPCWVLLPAVGTDWRWMRGRTDSPWYPSVRLIRQAAPGDWRAVADEVVTALARRA